MNVSISRIAAAVAVALFTAKPLPADILISGQARIDYHEAAWTNLASGIGSLPVLTMSAFFDQAEANALTQAELQTNAPTYTAYTNHIHEMNGAVVTNLSTRFTQPTTFAYTPGNLTHHLGQIGLGGVARFDVFGGLVTPLLYGDYTLQYDTNRITVGGSGWYLLANIPPVAPAYDLLNVSVVEGPGTFTISGDLGVTFEVANFLYSTPGDWLTDVGDFTFTAQTKAEPLPDTIASGVAFMTYDRAAWATLATNANYTDISGTPTGLSGPTADADGQRWMFPDRIEGTNWVSAPYPAAYLTAVPALPLVQPAGGFAMLVNSYGTNKFAANHKITAYHSTTNPSGYIGLGASLRATSDFNEPGASVWWQHLALRLDTNDSMWRIYATSGPGQGSLFELTNVTATTVNGSLRLSADYVFGDTDWLQFFQDVNGHLDPALILGHIELMPFAEAAATPVLGGGVAVAGSNLTFNATNGTPGSAYTLLSTTNLVQDPTVWRTNASGYFAPGGVTTVTLPLSTNAPDGYFRLQQP